MKVTEHQKPLENDACLAHVVTCGWRTVGRFAPHTGKVRQRRNPVSRSKVPLFLCPNKLYWCCV